MFDAAVFPSGGGAGPFGRRQRNPRGARVPVVLVTGFLGAGKTTLVRALLESEAGRGTAVVVNEFGEIGIDQAILAPAAEGRVALLGNGCLCCTVRSDLETTFRTLFADRARGAVPHFARIVLELSGADDPMPVLQTFADDRALGRAFHIQAIVAVVDAATGAAALADAPEAARQIALADRIVVSKADLADSAAIITAVRALNPAAPMTTASHGRVDPAFLLAEGTPPSRFQADAPRHRADLASFVLTFEAPFAWRTLTASLSLLCDLRGPDLLRAKGFCAVQGCEGPVAIHAVRHLLHRPVELDAWPDPADRRSRLVFITQGGLSPPPVRALFDAVVALVP